MIKMRVLFTTDQGHTTKVIRGSLDAIATRVYNLIKSPVDLGARKVYSIYMQQVDEQGRAIGKAISLAPGQQHWPG